MSDIFQLLRDLLTTANALAIAIGAMISTSGVYAAETATKICESFKYSHAEECKANELTWTAFDTCFVGLVGLLVITSAWLAVILIFREED